MQGTTTELLLMLVLVTLSAFFSATETAYSSFNRARLKSLADRGQKRAADTWPWRTGMTSCFPPFSWATISSISPWPRWAR